MQCPKKSRYGVNAQIIGLRLADEIRFIDRIIEPLRQMNACGRYNRQTMSSTNLWIDNYTSVVQSLLFPGVLKYMDSRS